MQYKSIEVVFIASVLLIFNSASVSANDQYGIRCNPGHGRLPRDGVICFVFRPETVASDFDEANGLGQPQLAYVAANKRAMAVDCPNKNPDTNSTQDIFMSKKLTATESEAYLILKGQAQSGQHRCCIAQWATGDGAQHKWCPDMAPLSI